LSQLVDTALDVLVLPDFMIRLQALLPTPSSDAENLQPLP
jgi:hypothetical protein